MKVFLSLQNYRRMTNTLAQAGFEIKDTFTGDLIQQSARIRDRAKEVLAEESRKRTNQRYWTGRLHEAIESKVVTREGSAVGTSVGVDLRKAPYAEWVEIGHYKVAGDFGSERGDWWEGYHFLERAFAEIGPEISSQIAKTIRIQLKNFESSAGRFRHGTTKRFVKGSAGFNIE